MSAPVLAHLGPVSQAVTLLLAAGAAALYVAGSRHGRARPSSGARASAAGALVAYLVATSAPLSARADASFAWHMAQHLLLVVVVPVLVVLARPGPPLQAAAHALAPSATRAGRRLVRQAPAPGPVAVVAAAVAAVALWAWHHPDLYDGAVASEPLHAVEHVTLLGTSLVVWLAATGRRTPHQAALVALVITALAGATLGALLTFAPRPLYDAHIGSGDVLADQQLAGLLMWVPGGLVPLAAASLVAADWIRVAARRVELRERVRATAAGRAPLALTACLALAASLSACGDDGGDPTSDRARQAIETYGCAACHRVPGVSGADGRIGPALDDYGRQRYIAGALVNTPENLARWIRDPQDVEPGTAMPDVGVTRRDADAIAAYLSGLGG